MTMERINNAIILAGGYGTRDGMLTGSEFGMEIGNMQKSVLPIVNEPNIVRQIEQLHSQCGVTSFFINTHFKADDVISAVGYGKKFGPNVKIYYDVSPQLDDIGQSVKDLVFNKFRKEFENDNLFWLSAGDKSFPTANLFAFQKYFFNKSKSLKNVLSPPHGAIGFVVRPAEYMIKKYPSATINKYGVISGFTKHMVKDLNEAKSVYGQSPFLYNLAARNIDWIPLNTSYYILNKKIFDVVPIGDDINPNIIEHNQYDFGKYIFPHLTDDYDSNMLSRILHIADSRLLAFIFDETPNPNNNRFSLYEYYDIGSPADYFRAQWNYIRTSFNQIKGNYKRDINSVIGNNVTIKGTVINSVIGDNVKVGEKCAVENSIIGACSQLFNVKSRGCLVLPFTYFNYDARNSLLFDCSYSILGGKSVGGSFFDRSTTGTRKFVRQVAVPDKDGIIKSTELEINENDIDNTHKSFQDSPNKDPEIDPTVDEP